MSQDQRPVPGTHPVRSILSNIGIPIRIAIACLLPLAGLMLFAGKNLIGTYSEYARGNQVAQVAAATPAISALVHDMQRERGMSAGFISTQGQSFGDALRQQRKASDTAFAAWETRGIDLANGNAGTKLSDEIAKARTKLAQLADTRRAVDSFAIPAAKAAEYYSGVIADLVSIIDSMSDLTEDGRIVHQAIALAAQVRRKEFAGQERATGAVGFGAGSFSAPVYLNFLRVRTIQDAQAAIFRRNAEPGQIAYVEDAIKGPVVQELTRLRDIGGAAPFNPAAVKGVTGPQWFEASTKYIDILKTVEDRLVQDFTSMVDGIVAGLQRSLLFLAAMFAVVFAVTCTMTAIVALSITRPIAGLVETMRRLSRGDLAAEVAGADRGDEIGAMASALQVFKDNAVALQAAEAEAAEQRRVAEEERARNEAVRADAARQIQAVVAGLGAGLERLAHGDLTYRVTDEWAAEYRKIQHDFNEAADQLRDMILGIVGSTSEVSSAAAEISTATTDLSQRTEEQAASLEQTSASMEEIAATVRQNAENAAQARDLTRNTTEIANRGGEVAAQAVEAMARIEESSRRIADITSVIDEIARQTNLLALNAAVEAARAGEAGRGFAVVASEVRSLAQRSSQAAKDIKDLIVNSSGQVQDGVALVNRAGGSLKEIVNSIKTVADMVSDIANASAEQSAGLEQVNKALSQMDEVTQHNSAMVEENAASARTLEQQAEAMNQRLAAFRLDSDTRRRTQAPVRATAA